MSHRAAPRSGQKTRGSRFIADQEKRYPIKDLLLHDDTYSTRRPVPLGFRRPWVVSLI